VENRRVNMPQDLPLPALGPPPDGLELEKLDRYLAYEDHPDDHPVARWSITNDGAAEWALRKLAELEREASAVQLQAEEWVEQITSWAEERGAKLSKSAAFFRDHLERYGLARRELTGAATVELPTGKVATRAGNPRAVIGSPELLVKCLKRLNRPDLVRVREDVLISQLLEDQELHARYHEVPTVWKVGLDCGCVTLHLHPDRFNGAFPCPECETAGVHVVDMAVEVEGHWQLLVDINGKTGVELPGVEVIAPSTSSTVTIR